MSDFRLTENTIAMRPVFYRTQSVREKSVLLHERSHGVLHSTYSTNSYVNSHYILQEALADFLTAHHLNDGRIGRVPELVEI